MATASTYKVKKGDTLSQIAQSFGVKASDITGYRSGNADRIFEGETLSIGRAPASTTAPPPGSDYASTVRDQLGGSSPAGRTDPLSESSISPYKERASTASKNKEAAFNALKGARESIYQEEYKNAGLEKTKQKLSSLDTDIAKKKAERDAAIAKSQQNPGASAATLAGDKGKALDFYNDQINGLIEQRNGVASEYNAGLGELDRVVGNRTKDLETEYSFWDSEEKNAQSQVDTFTKALIDALREDEQYEREDARNAVEDAQWARELEVAMQKAADGGGGGYNLQLITDPNTGNPKGLFDPRKGTVTPIPGAPTTSTGFDSIQVPAPAASTKQKTWWNPLTWF